MLASAPSPKVQFWRIATRTYKWKRCSRSRAEINFLIRPKRTGRLSPRAMLVQPQLLRFARVFALARIGKSTLSYPAHANLRWKFKCRSGRKSELQRPFFSPLNESAPICSTEIKAENKTENAHTCSRSGKQNGQPRRLRTIKSCLSSCNYKINERDAAVVGERKQLSRPFYIP